MDHLGAGVAGEGEVGFQENGFLGAGFLTVAAIDAAEHVDFECLRGFFDVGVGAVGGDGAGGDADGFRGADKFAELAGDAFFASVGVADEGGCATVVGGELGADFGVFEGDGFGEEVADGNPKPADDLREVGSL